MDKFVRGSMLGASLIVLTMASGCDEAEPDREVTGEAANSGKTDEWSEESDPCYEECYGEAAPQDASYDPQICYDECLASEAENKGGAKQLEYYQCTPQWFQVMAKCGGPAFWAFKCILTGECDPADLLPDVPECWDAWGEWAECHFRHSPGGRLVCKMQGLPSEIQQACQ